MIRLARRVLGVLLLAVAARWAWRALVIHFHATGPWGEALDAHDNLVRLRIRPLSPAELETARELERELAELRV